LSVSSSHDEDDGDETDNAPTLCVVGARVESLGALDVGERVGVSEGNDEVGNAVGE